MDRLQIGHADETELAGEGQRLVAALLLGKPREHVRAGVVEAHPTLLLDRKTTPTREKGVAEIVLGAGRSGAAEVLRPPSAGRARSGDKDWPILAETSVYGARLALGAKRQGKYDAAHAALMGLRGQKVSEASMMQAVRAAGVDMAALGRDLKAHDSDIGDLLKRNDDQAKTLGLQGTPVYLIGPFIVAAALDYDGFKDAVAKLRAHIGKYAPRSQ